MAEVSVLIITYNHREYIRQCINSVLSQKTNFSYEVLIHDDASNDGTQDIIKEYQKTNQNIKTVLQKQNQYSKVGFHPDDPLLTLINGKYVCLVEGDDYWCDERKLQKQYDALEKEKKCSICVHNVKYLSKDGKELYIKKKKESYNEGVIASKQIFEDYFVRNNWPFQTSSFFMRTSYFINRPDFWKKFYVGDLPIILWFAHNGDFYYIDDTMSCYRLFTTGSATNLNRNKEYAIKKVKTNAEGLIAFNEYTNGIHWTQIKHITSYYIYHYYCATNKIISKKYFYSSKSELTYQEKIIAKIKYTKVGYIIRNMRENFLKLRMERS